MKIFNQIRYVLFALMVLGSFASFAQNEYGINILYVSELLIGVSLLIESFIYLRNREKLGKAKRFYFFTESFALGILFMSYGFWIWGPSALARLPALIGMLIVFLLYFGFAIRSIVKEPKNGKLQTLFVFLFVIITTFLVTALTWKINHWPGSTLQMWYSSCGALFMAVLVIIKRKYYYKGENITLKDRLLKIPGKMPVVFCYYSIWVIYISLIMIGVAPNFYTLSNPPAVEKLKQNNSPRADIYWENLDNFFENRRTAEEK